LVGTKAANASGQMTYQGKTQLATSQQAASIRADELARKRRRLLAYQAAQSHARPKADHIASRSQASTRAAIGLRPFLHQRFKSGSARASLGASESRTASRSM